MRETTVVVAPGVTREEYCWGFFLRGRKEALITAGFAEEDWFVRQDELDSHGRRRRQKKFVVKGIEIGTLLPAHGPAEINISRSKEEAKAMHEIEQSEREVREAEVRYQYHDYVRELERRLQIRYPHVRIVYVNVTMHDNTIQQNIRFLATKSHLLAAGLATEKMFECEERYSTTELGCGYILCESLDSQSVKGCWDLFVYTGEVPHDHGRGITKKNLRETSKILVEIFAGKANAAQ